MSCVDLMYHQTLTTGFPYHHSQRSITDIYCSNYNNPVSGATCTDYHAQVEETTASRMLQPLGREVSSTLQPSEFASSVSSSTTSSSLGIVPAQPAPTSPTAQQLNRSGSRLLSATGSASAQRQSLSLASAPSCGGVGGGGGGPQPPAVVATHQHSHFLGAAVSSSPPSSTSSSSPSLASSSTLSPSLSYFPVISSSSSSSSSVSSAFTSRPPAYAGSDVAFPPTPASSIFLPPPPSSSLSPASSYSSSLKRSSSEVDDLDDVSVPKKTRYVTSNCVLLTYHDRDTSSEVDEHFSKALSSPASSSCGYGSGAATRHSSSGESPPMSQRNFPPSFWDATHYLRQHCTAAAAASYNYHHAAFGSGTASSSQNAAGFFTGPATHDTLYPLSSPFLSGSLGMPPGLHPSFSSLHKDPWASFPFASGSKSTLNYYPYPRAGAYTDPHAAFSPSYAAQSAPGSSGRFSGSSYGSFLLPSTSSTVRGSGGHFPPSATITSGQCATGDLGARLTGEHCRAVFAGSGSLAGLDSSAHEAGKDFHWF